MMNDFDNAEHLLGQLELLGHKLGLAIRYEALNVEVNEESNVARGGLCRIREKKVVLVDSRLCSSERCRVLAEALSAFDLSTVFIPPAVRSLIDAYQGGNTLDSGG